MKLQENYKARAMRFIELWQSQDWRMKIYNITYEGKQSDTTLIEAAKAVALSVLPQPAVTPRYYGVGFIGVHQGHSYDFVFINYWNYETELKQHTFMRAGSSSSALESLAEQDLSHDVWDLHLLAFERDAWVKHVLTKPEASLDDYLAEHLNTVV